VNKRLPPFTPEFACKSIHFQRQKRRNENATHITDNLVTAVFTHPVFKTET
jgi:hypothetical protein